MNTGPAQQQGRTRLFVGLMPARDEQRALATAVARIAHGGRAVPAGNLHLTLAFLGAVPVERVAALEDALGSVAAEAFELRLERVGHFPRPRVLWCAATAAPGPLYALQGAVLQALAAAGMGLEVQPFTPHVTVARKVSRYRGPERLARPVCWRLGEFRLVASRTLPEGARYDTLRAFRLHA